MKKLTTLFTESYHELSHVRTTTVAAFLGSVSVVLGYLAVPIGEFGMIRFSTIANQLVYFLFGPVVGACYGFMVDILGYVVKPVNGYMPGLTLISILGGVLYGVLLYKKPISFKRIAFAQLVVALICNVWLRTWFLSLVNGESFMAVIPFRIGLNLITWPVHSVMFYLLSKTLEKSGIFRFVKENNYAGSR